MGAQLCTQPEHRFYLHSIPCLGVLGQQKHCNLKPSEIMSLTFQIKSLASKSWDFFFFLIGFFLFALWKAFWVQTIQFSPSPREAETPFETCKLWVSCLSSSSEGFKGMLNDARLVIKSQELAVLYYYPVMQLTRQILPTNTIYHASHDIHLKAHTSKAKQLEGNLTFHLKKKK